DATDQLIQANVVAAKYDVAPLSVAPASATTMPTGLQTFSPGSSQDTVVTFTNTTGTAVTGVALSIAVPTRWTAVARGAACFCSVPAALSASAARTGRRCRVE